MATPADVISLLQSYDNIVQTELPQAQSIISQMQAIDPSAPDATSQLTALQQQYQTLKNDPARAAAYQAYSDAYDSLSSSDQAIVNNDPETAVNKSLSAQSTAGTYASTLASVQAAIANANSVPPAGGNTKQMSGPADDDSASATTNPTGAPQQPTTGTGQTPPTPASTGTVAAPDPNAKTNPTSSGNASPKSSTIPSTPGRRLKNPLAYLSSYTYQITLYMLTPDAYDAFIASGRQSINIINQAVSAGSGPPGGGAWIVAQSGGINNSPPGPGRASGFNYDYYIDNLVMKQTCAAHESGTATNTTTVTFTITEPYGFSFVTNLRRASDAITAYTKTLGKSSPYDPTKQIFVLGVKFIGWNADGSLAKPTDIYGGQPLDPNSTDGSLFQHYHDIQITAIKTRIDGKTVVYNVDANAMPPGSAFTKKRGVCVNDVKVTGPTVQDAIQQLITQLNKIETDKTKTNPPVQKNPTTYAISFTPDAQKLIATASIVTPANTEKNKQPTTNAPATTTQSNPATELTAKANPKARELNFSAGWMILEIINSIIAQSTYLTDALKSFNTNAIQADPKKDGFSQINSPNKDTISWYNCGTKLSKPIWDTSINDWVYTITYVIDTYLTPSLTTPYAKQGSKYYGPHKHYDYWYTGKNTEVISYEQTLNNLYYTVALQGGAVTDDSGTGGTNNSNSQTNTNSTGTTSTAAGTAPNTAAPNSNSSSIVPNQPTKEPTQGSTGYGMEAQNSYITSLYDPSAVCTMNMTIFGDPDYLMQESPSTINQVYNKFYGNDGFTINPNGGDVFIEVDFKEAVDYTSGGGSSISAGNPSTGGISTNPGTLSINNSIAFFSLAPTVQTNGIPYKLTAVENTFAQGSFKQKLTGTIAPLPGAQPDTSGNARPSTSTSGTAAGPSTPTSVSSSNSGTKNDPPVNSAQPQQPAANTSSNTPNQSTTSHGVANDDGHTKGSPTPTGPSPGPNYVWNSTMGTWVTTSNGSSGS